MKITDYQKSIFYRELVKDKELQESIERLQNNKDFKQIQKFGLHLQELLLDGLLNCDNLKDLQQGKDYIFAVMAFVWLPQMVELVRKDRQRIERDIKESEENKKRRLFNPGSWVK